MFVDPENPDASLKKPDLRKDQLKPRDGDGKFVSKDTKPEDAATKTYQVSGAAVTINNALKDPSIDKPLLSLTINNPLRKLLQWVKEIKKKQTTTFEFKVKVPLIALPVFLFVLGSAFTYFFNLGKEVQKQDTKLPPAPSPVITVLPTVPPVPIFISKVGIVKGTYQVLGLLAQQLPTDSPTPTFSPTPTHMPTVTPLPTATPTPPLSRFVLLDKDERLTFLITKTSIKLENYLDKRVLILGLYDQTKNTLEIKKASDIEVLP